MIFSLSCGFILIFLSVFIYLSLIRDILLFKMFMYLVCFGLAVNTVIQEAADRIVGSRQHKRQPWLSDEAHDVVMEKSAARKRSDHTERRRLQNVYNGPVVYSTDLLACRDHDAFLNRTVSEAEKDASKGKMGSVFRAVRVISGKDASSVNVSIAKQDGSIHNIS